MYSRKVPNALLYSKHNLTAVSARQVMTNPQCSLTIARLRKTYDSFRASVQRIIAKKYVFNSLKDRLFVHAGFRNDATNIVRVWTHQCECVVAQRIRRGQQMFSLYTKLWDEHALRAFLNRMKQQFARHSRELVFSAVGVSAYNWDKYRIRDEELIEHIGELEYGRFLKEKTVMCEICSQDPAKINSKKIIFCDCPGRKGDFKTYDNWTIFIEREDMIVWRKQLENGCFEYKIFGSYDDVTAEDFLNVQIDTDYRRNWDTTAVSLELIESDPQETSNSDVLYWEMMWPKLFTNRDYVFNRRYLIDESKKTMLIFSKATHHPSYPSKHDKFRIEDYWSSMVIKPYKDFNKLGVEYSLTYYDNPGVNIPASITAWVAYRIMPDFLIKLRVAARQYADYCQSNNCRGIYSTDNADDDDEDYETCIRRKAKDLDLFEALLAKLDKFGDEDGSLEDFDTTRVSNENDTATTAPSIIAKLLSKPDNTTTDSKSSNNLLTTEKVNSQSPPVDKLTTSKSTGGVKSTTAGIDVMTSPSPMTQSDLTNKQQTTYWKYLHPTYYFT